MAEGDGEKGGGGREVGMEEGRSSSGTEWDISLQLAQLCILSLDWRTEEGDVKVVIGSLESDGHITGARCKAYRHGHMADFLCIMHAQLLASRNGLGAHPKRSKKKKEGFQAQHS